MACDEVLGVVNYLLTVLVLIIDLSRAAHEPLLLLLLEQELLVAISIVSVVDGVLWRCILVHCHELPSAYSYRLALRHVVLRLWLDFMILGWRHVRVLLG
jgi:hypothetical protein